MPDSVYKVIEIVGSSSESWEKAASAAVEKAGKSVRDSIPTYMNRRPL